jgi:glucoamylase
VGNLAYQQKQHDIYGEIIAAVELLCSEPQHDPGLRDLVNALLDAIENNFHAPDAGLWEKRDTPEVHTFSLLMHWYGCRAAMRVAAGFSDTHMAERAFRLGEMARNCILDECWREEAGFFAESPVGNHADASLFLLVTTGFLDPDDPRARRHVEYLARKLKVKGHLLYRYRHDDGIGATLSTFTVCGFWYAEALACLGEVEACREVVNAILRHANHVGLLSEDVDPESGELWGNMPQTYSHVGIIDCALALDRAEVCVRPDRG